MTEPQLAPPVIVPPPMAAQPMVRQTMSIAPRAGLGPNAPLGGTDTTAIAAGTNVPSIIKTGPGRLCRVIVTKPGSAPVFVYDSAVVAEGLILGAVPGDAPMGSIYDFQTRAIQGICVGGDPELPGITLTYY